MKKDSKPKKEKAPAKAEKHMDAAQDKKLIKKMMKKGCK